MHPDILDRILEWSTKRPSWQQDALQRLLRQGKLTDADESALYQRCRAESGLSSACDAVLSPPTNCLSNLTDLAHDITLLSISNPVHINSLASDQTLHFQSHGLTIVYGANGAGKSSYARILRRLCHSRSAPTPILPNVYQPAPDIPSSAIISYKAGGHPEKLSWSAQDETPTPLKSVRLYDTECARQHVGEAGEVNAPTLDVLYELGGLCQRIQNSLKDDKKVLAKDRPNWSDNPPISANSPIYKLLQNLEGIELPAPLHKSSQNRLKHLEILFLQGANDAAEWYLQQANVLQRLHDDLLTAQNALSDTQINQWQTLVNRIEEDIETARAALEANDAQSALTLMQQYVAHNEHSDKFATHPDCPICRQAYQQMLQMQWRGLRLLPVAKTLSLALRRFSVILKLRRRALLRNDPAKALELPLPTSPLPELIEMVQEVREQAALCRNLNDPLQYRQLERELEDLRAHQWLDEHRQAVETEMDRLGALKKLDQAIREAGTKAISLESRRLADLFVTDALRERFLEELEYLGLKQTLPVEFDAATAKNGSMHYQIRLAGAVLPAYLPNVLSEGEQQCIALAGFLTELVADQSHSALVFDDPMSSLDHMRREQVANRLVEEAQRRQVIIFTHDQVFLLNLQEAARRRQVDTQITQLSRTLNSAGLCLSDAPWPGMPVSKRIAYLTKYLRATKGPWSRAEYAEYEFRARAFYSLLRESWERVVEEILLNGVVARFERAVHTRPLRKLTDICEEDINTIESAMSKCSNFMLGHDEAPALNSRLPEFEELQADLSILKQFSETVQKRRREKR
ncbi:MAG: AAA family ATPase [Pseudomonadota bacterium]